MDEAIETYLKFKCEKVKEETGIDIFKLLINDFISLFKERDLMWAISGAENLINVAGTMIKSGAKINRRGRRFEESFCFTSPKNTRVIKI